MKPKLQKALVWCVVFCLVFPITLPILSYAENANITVNIDGMVTPLSIQPYTNDLGLMVDAREITEAYGLSCEFDSEQKSFTITNEPHGNIILMHNATKFYSGENEFPCEPYFYVENTIPMIELGFFCAMFDASYEYNQSSNTIFITREKIRDDIAKIKFNDTITSLYHQPFQGEFGLMVSAEEIAKAFGLKYAFDKENKAATLSDELHGDVILKDQATTFRSGENEFDCLPYFYLVNETPFIDVGFFCEMYGADFQYDENTKMLELFETANLSEINQNQIMPMSTESYLSGNVLFAPGVSMEQLKVNLVLQTFRSSRYGGTEIGHRYTLGTVSLTNGETAKSYRFNTTPFYSSAYPEYILYYEAPAIGKYGYYGTNGTTVQLSSPPDQKKVYNGKHLNASTSTYANIDVAFSSLSGNIQLNNPAPANGIDVKLILQQTDQRGSKYQPTYVVLGNRYNLGTVHFDTNELLENYNYDISPYYSTQYADFSLFFEAPNIGKYGYYNISDDTTTLNSKPNYNDTEYYYSNKAKSLSLSANITADLAIDFTSAPTKTPPVTTVTADENNWKIQMNTTPSLSGVTVRLALYDKNGRVIHTQSQPSGDEIIFVVPKDSAAYKGKIFIWDSELHPLCNAQELTLQATDMGTLKNKYDVVIQAGKTDFYVDHKPAPSMLSPAFQYNQGLMIPLRSVGEGLGCSVEYDSVQQSVTFLRKNNDKLTILFDEDIAWFNGAPVQLSQPSSIFYNATYLPITDILSILGYSVVYYDETGLVTAMNSNSI